MYGGGLNKIEPSELGRISTAAFVERWPELRSGVQRQGELFGELSGRTSDKGMRRTTLRAAADAGRSTVRSRKRHLTEGGQGEVRKTHDTVDSESS